MPFKDPEKRREYNKLYQKKHYKKKKQYYMDKAAAQKAVTRAWFDEFKSGLQCEICGESDPVCLDFHHIDADLKEVNIAGALQLGWPRPRILNEIAKCTVLCSNCHRKLHWQKKLKEI